MNFADYLLEHSRNLLRPFLMERDQTITYPDLVSSVNSLTTIIRTTYGAGNMILLMAENSYFFIVCYLAIIQSGNTVVLVETRIGDADLSKIQKSCSIRACFVQNRFIRRFPDQEDILSESVLDQNVVPVSNRAETREDDVAVIIYTSGSTGAKKGVMLTHANLRANTESILGYLPLTSQDRVGVLLPFYYCYGASLLHTHLRVGGSLVISSLVFPASFLSDLRRFHCTGFSGVPSTFQILVNKTSFLREEFPELRYYTQAGGQLATKYIEMILDAFPDKQFYIMYGATEATARLSYLPPNRVREKLGSIGKGIPGVTLEVLNPEGTEVRPGEIGEITARGRNIMKGYFQDPEGTREVLREGRLSTGDLATVDAEGFIYIVGRAKNIIKSGGYRISPLEIEDFIISLPRVEGCVIIGIPDEIMGEAIVAVVQADGAYHEILAAEIMKACRDGFPSYKVPRALEFVREYPLNSSHKVDRSLLREIILKRIKDRSSSI